MTLICRDPITPTSLFSVSLRTMTAASATEASSVAAGHDARRRRLTHNGPRPGDQKLGDEKPEFLQLQGDGAASSLPSAIARPMGTACRPQPTSRGSRQPMKWGVRGRTGVRISY